MNTTLRISRTNTILYCDQWAETVAFYRDRLNLPVTHATDWFVEIHLNGSTHLSLANASRSSIAPGYGVGITLSWQVPDATEARNILTRLGISVSETASRWNSNYVEFHDPEGTRIELWSPSSSPQLVARPRSPVQNHESE